MGRGYPMTGEQAEVAKQEARRDKARERRREKSGFYTRPEREMSAEERREEAQADDAREAGRAAGDRVNLQPFLSGEAPSTSPQLEGKE